MQQRMKGIDKLTAHEAKIYRQISGIDCPKRSIEEVAELFGLTQKEVVEIEASAHAKLAASD